MSASNTLTALSKPIEVLKAMENWPKVRRWEAGNTVLQAHKRALLSCC